MTRLTTSAARKDFAETVNKVAYTGERVIVHRRGKDVAALISVKELRLLDRLYKMFENHSDIKAARAALDEAGDNIPYDEVRRELGLLD